MLKFLAKLNPVNWSNDQWDDYLWRFIGIALGSVLIALASFILLFVGLVVWALLQQNCLALAASCGH